MIHLVLTYCIATILASTHHVQKGPTCLIASSQTAISVQGTAPTFKDLSRHVPILPTGIHAYDLAVELKKRQWESLIFTGPPEAIARLIEAGFAVVAFIYKNGNRHSVAITGVKRVASSTQANQCGRAVHKLLMHDPNQAKPLWITAKSFAKIQSNQQLMVFYHPKDLSKLSAAGFPTRIAQKVDRRFRADTLLKRAKRHSKANKQQLFLLKRALKYDPCFQPVRTWLHELEHKLKYPHSKLPICQNK